MDKIEVLLYPCPWVYISQNSCTSRAGSHMYTNAIDLAGKNPDGYERLYAPCTLKVKTINKNSKSSEIIFWSCDEKGNDARVRVYNNKTKTYFEDYLTIRVVHKMDVNMFVVGKIFKQGDWFYNTGTRGLKGPKSVPMHAHFEVTRGYTTEVKMTDTRPHIQGQNLVGAIKPEEHLTLTKDIHTIAPFCNDDPNWDGARGNKLLWLEDIEAQPKKLMLEIINGGQQSFRDKPNGIRVDPDLQLKGELFELHYIDNQVINGFRWANVTRIKDSKVGFVQCDFNNINIYIK